MCVSQTTRRSKDIRDGIIDTIIIGSKLIEALKLNIDYENERIGLENKLVAQTQRSDYAKCKSTDEPKDLNELYDIYDPLKCTDNGLRRFDEELGYCDIVTYLHK